MSNNPKKSRALVITLIIIVVLFLGVYLLYKNKDSFDPKTSALLNKIFSPLGTSENENNLEVVQAGEDIKKGDQISILTGTNSGNNTSGTNNSGNNVNVVVKANGSNEVYGTAYEDMSSGDLGKIIKNQKKQANKFYESFSKFLDKVLNKQNKVDYDTWDGIDPNNTNQYDPNNNNNNSYDPNTNPYDPSNNNNNSYDPNTNPYDPSNLNNNPYDPNNPDNIKLFNLPTVEMTADQKEGPTITVKKDSDVTLTWTSEKATSCELKGDLSKSSGGNSSGTSGRFYTGPITESKSYSVICKNDKGHTASDTVMIFLEGGAGGNTGVPQIEISDIPKVDLTADQTVVKLNSDVTLTWTSEKATSCELKGDLSKSSGGNSSGTSGRFYTGPITESKSYSVICKNDKGHTASDTVMIFLNNISDYYTDNFDLTAGSVYPVNVKPNTDIKLSALIINNGEKEIKNSFQSFFVVRNDSEENIHSEPIITPALKGNTSTEVSITYKFTKEGLYTARACADKKDQNDTGSITPELNENNNCGPWTVIYVNTSLPTEGEKCENGAINPPTCTIDSNNKCINGMTNPPACDKSDDNNGEDDKDSNKEDNKCLLIEQNPLVFTDEEESELAELLRKYYVIAPSLKTEDDITLIYKDIDRYKTEVEKIDNLTYQCNIQTSPSNGYTGPTTRGGNPWYNYTNRTSYIGGGSSGYCKGSVSSDYLNSASWTYWFNGIPDDLEVCNSAYRNESSTNCMYGMRGHDNMLTGCTWVEGNYLQDYEKILNIW